VNDAPDLASYDTIIVAFSGGKDSLACLLHLIECGVPREKVELWHHDVDGREGSKLMDWPCTRDYCRKVAAAFGVTIYFSWKQGGFEREMLRDHTATAPIMYETPTGLRQTGGAGKPNTRRVFPQVSPDLSVRWCSAYLKIDVGAAAVRGQERFLGKRTLFVTGERAQESAARARYSTFEPHRADNRARKNEARPIALDQTTLAEVAEATGVSPVELFAPRPRAHRLQRRVRHVDAWRPVHGWTEEQVWAIIERHAVNPHPAYRLGWGRVSCAACIFGNADQWASLRAVHPEQFATIARHEQNFGKTIKRKLSVVQTADTGRPYTMAEEDIRAALSEAFDEPVFLDVWKLPQGAYGDSCGPS